MSITDLYNSNRHIAPRCLQDAALEETENTHIPLFPADRVHQEVETEPQTILEC